MKDSATYTETLLTEVGRLKDRHDVLAAANGENFNVFKLLGRETDEVHTHSAILADLLNPRGSHGQGVAFASKFKPFEQLGLDGDKLKKARVQAEVAKSIGRIDILIETDQWCIVIENKIYADDQPRQMERYHEFASNEGKRYKLFYLTLWGDCPSKKSLGDLSESCVDCISYQAHVLNWLEDCIKEVALVPRIREILNQYRGVVRRLTGMAQEELTMEIKELLRRTRGDAYNFELAPAIADAYTELSIDAEWKFWDELRQLLLQSTKCSALESSECFKEVSRNVLQTAHRGSRDRYGYGWTFHIQPKTELPRVSPGSQEILLRIECDGGRVYYGFVAMDRNEKPPTWLHRSAVDGELYEWWSSRLVRLGERWRNGDQRWLRWCFPEQNVHLGKTTALDHVVIRKLLHEDAATPLADEISKAVCRMLDDAPREH